MQTPSKLFYQGKLKPDRSVSDRPPVSFFHETQLNNVFWHVEGVEREFKFRSAHGGLKSKYNMGEANAVVGNIACCLSKRLYV